MLWGFVSFIPLYRNFYWDYLARRVAWKDYYSWSSEDQKKEKAESLKADWGYNPRYEPILGFSIKAAKYST